jgi:hypothetical protein
MAPAAADETPTVAEAVGDPATAEAHRAAAVKEYGQFVAIAPIDHDGVRAYNVGDPVPASNVERWHYVEQGVVSKVGTKGAEAAVKAAATPVGRG